ncbi:pre-rRNA processing protein, partial [Tieghemiomyces parasiticus]
MTDVDQLSSSLQRIRLQSSSKLDNQQQVSATLLAIEETLKEQGSTLSPTAYFAALSTLLEQQGGNNSGIIYAVLYLLAVVLPGVPAAVLRAKHTVVLKCLGPIVTEPDTATPTLRAALVCLAVLLRSLDAGAWVEPAIKQALQALLLLAVDPRPKVRKDSLEQVSALLGTSPAASDRPSPPAVLAGRTALQLLKDCARVSEAQMTIRVLALVRHLTPAWTSTTLTPLYRALLALPDVGNTNVGVAVFSTFEHLLARSAAGLDATQSQTVLAHLARIKPAATDAAAVAAWYRCVTQGLIAYTARNPATCLGNLVDMFDSLFEDLQMGERPAVHALVTDALLTLTRECLPHALPHLPGPAGDVPALVQLRDTLVTGTTYRYRDTLDRVFAVQAAAFRALGPHSAPLLDPVLRGVADLRMQTDFTFKTEADTVLRAALSAVGPAHFLEVLPLNLDPVAAARQQGASGDHVGRAWLLPLLKDGLRQAPLAYFVGTLLPLADRLAEVAGDFETKGRDMEAKIYHTLQHQVWALLSAFCRTPAAVPTAFTQEFAERLSDVLYGEPELRPIVCNALQTLVRRLRRGAELGEDDDDDVDEEGKAHDVASDAGVASDNDDSDNEESGRRAGRRGTKSATTHADESPVSPDVARAGIAHLSGFAANYLSVLFNVYSTLPMGGRGFVLDAITTLLEITPVADVQSTFTKVQELMAPELAGLTTPGVENPALTDMALTMLDLTQVMAPYVDLAAFPTFPDQIITLVTLQSHPAAQKKGYKLLYNLLQRARASGPVTPAGVLSEATQA